MAFRLTAIGSYLSSALSGVGTGAFTVLYARRQNVNRQADSCELEAYGGSQATGIVSSGNGMDFRGHANWAAASTDYVTASLDVWSWRLVVGDGSQIRFYHKSDAGGGSWTEFPDSPIAQTAHSIATLIFGDNRRGEPFFGDYAGIRAWSSAKSPASRIAEISSRTPVDTSGLILHKLGAGSSLSAALAAGTGSMSASGSASLISDMPATLAESGEEPQPPQTVTISGSADVDLGDPDPGPGPGTPPAIVTTSLPAGQVGVPYSAQIVITGSPPLSFGLDGLPNGLTFFAQDAPSGLAVLLSGTPTGTGGLGGSYPLSIIANNSDGTDSATITLTIGDASAPLPVVTTEQMPPGRVGESYSFTFSASNAPTNWFFVGAMPPGMATSGPTISSGSLQVAGTFNIGVRAGNASGTGPVRSFPFVIAPRRRAARIASPWGTPLRRGR